MSNSKINSWDWDIRVRERNLKQGILTDKDVEKQRGGLPDMVEHSEAVSIAQPAVGTGVDADDDDEPGGDEAGPAEDAAS